MPRARHRGAGGAGRVGVLKLRGVAPRRRDRHAPVRRAPARGRPAGAVGQTGRLRRPGRAPRFPDAGAVRRRSQAPGARTAGAGILGATVLAVVTGWLSAPKAVLFSTEVRRGGNEWVNTTSMWVEQ